MIIFLNGSINAGKSTVAKLLVKELPNTALLEIDALREMIDWMPLHDSIPLNLENAASVIRNFVKRGLNVIVPYPLSQQDYQYMVDSLQDHNEKILVFTLAPNIEKALTNRGNRELVDWEVKRIKEQYEKGIHALSFGEVIDNSEQTPEETVNYILSKINS